MNIKQETVGSVEVISLEGRLDVHSAPILLDILDSLIKLDVVKIVIDMAGIEYISSYGIGVLVSTTENTKGKGGELKLVGLQPEVNRSLDIMGLSRRIGIFNNCEDAIKSFSETNEA